MIDWSLAGKLVYDCALLASAILAIRCGGTSERIAVGMLVLASGATGLAFPIAILLGVRARYGLLAIDVALLVAYDALMVRSRARWPIWLTGFQLAAVAIEMAAVLDPPSARLYMYIQGKFAYLLLAAIDFGAIGHWQATRALKQAAHVQ